MKLILKIKPEALFKLRILIEEELERTIKYLDQYEDRNIDELTDFEKEHKCLLEKDLTALENLHSAYFTAVDNMVTWIE